jgi:hypothetical protein
MDSSARLRPTRRTERIRRASAGLVEAASPGSSGERRELMHGRSAVTAAAVNGHRRVDRLDGDQFF